MKELDIKLLEALELNQKNKNTFHIGMKAKFSGVYRCGIGFDKNQYIPLSKGETFPPANGLDSMEWFLVVKL